MDCVGQVRCVAEIADGRLGLTQFNSRGRPRVNLYPSRCGGGAYVGNTIRKLVLFWYAPGHRFQRCTAYSFTRDLGSGQDDIASACAKAAWRVRRLFVLNCIAVTLRREYGAQTHSHIIILWFKTVIAESYRPI